MPNVGAGEILVILLLALLVLGPDKLPGAARSIGKTMSQVRKLSSGFEQEVRSAMHSADPSSPATPASPSAPASPAAPASMSGPSGTLHPGLGPGPRLEPGSVVLNGTSSSDAPSGSTAPASPAGSRSLADDRITGEGPSGSFS